MGEDHKAPPTGVSIPIRSPSSCPLTLFAYSTMPHHLNTPHKPPTTAPHKAHPATLATTATHRSSNNNNTSDLRRNRCSTSRCRRRRHTEGKVPVWARQVGFVRVSAPHSCVVAVWMLSSKGGAAIICLGRISLFGWGRRSWITFDRVRLAWAGWGLMLHGNCAFLYC